jgi:hypothetical protein
MDLHSVNALRNLGHIFDQLSFNKEDVSNEFSDLKHSCEKLLVEKRQQSKLERQRTGNALARLVCVCAIIFVCANYFCCYFVLNIYSCYVEVCVTVSNENFICKYSVVILT